MPENKDLPIVPFPMKIYWNEEPETKFMNEQQAFKVTMLDYPRGDFRRRCAVSSMSTWNYTPIKLTEEEVNTIFKEILTFKMLPNSMESLMFTFRFHNLTHIEISHILRHRLFAGILATASGDRCLRKDSAMIPEAIQKSKFANRYKELTKMCKELYADMVDSKEVSLMDARYILNRNHCYDYVISMNLKEAINFINQRKCSAVQPISDNLIAKELYDNLITVIPELKDIVSLKCDKSCHFIRNIKNNTRLYLPDSTHDKLFDYNPDNFVYKKRRFEMNIPKTVQDE